MQKDEIALAKGINVGFLVQEEKDISEVHSDSDINYPEVIKEEINACESEGEESEEPLHGFITSPADIDVHRKVVLPDLDIDSKDEEKFARLCKEFTDIFSERSADIGKISLIKMGIDTGDSPPTSQKPYNLPLKHVDWVNRELRILEEVGVIELFLHGIAHSHSAKKKCPR